MTEETKPTADSTASTPEPRSKPCRLRPWLLSFCAAGLAIFLVFEWAPWEPRHGGKRLGKWLEQLKHGDEGEREQASKALLAIGPEAAPGLARILVEGDSALNRRYEAWVGKLPTTIAEFLPNPNRVGDGSRNLAFVTLETMGEAAMPAWPTLRASFAKTNIPASSLRVRFPAPNTVHELFFNLHPDDPETVDALLDAYIGNPEYHGQFSSLAALMRRNPEVADAVTPRLVEAAETESRRTPRHPGHLTQACSILGLIPQQHPAKASAIKILKDVLRRPLGIETNHVRYALWRLAPEDSSPMERAKILAKMISSKDRMAPVSAWFYIHTDFRPTDPDVVQLLVDATLRKVEFRNRVSGIELHILRSLGSNTVPFQTKIHRVVRPLMSQPNIYDSTRAIETLWVTSQDPETLCPALVEELLDRLSNDTSLGVPFTIVKTLGVLGPAANEALPQLRDLRDAENVSLRVQVAESLWRVGGEPEALLKIIRDRLEQEVFSPNHNKLEARDELFPLLEELDAHAKPLVPLLVQLAEHPYTLPHTRERTIEVLQKIAPETLAQIDKEILERCLRYINWRREFEANHGWN